jgi:hypothetical protein
MRSLAAVLLLGACDAVFGLRGKVLEPDAFSLDGVDACSETVGGNSRNSLLELCLPNLPANPIPSGGIIDTGSDECGHIDMVSMCAFISPNAPMLINGLRATGPMPLLLVADTIDIEGKVEVQSEVRAAAQGPSAEECPLGAAGLNGGGAGGSYNSAGGDGGAPNGATNSGGSAVPAPVPSSMWTAARFVGGCSGGVGGGPAGGPPGFGGGAVYLAAKTITIGSAGSINASGAAGLGAKGPGGGGGGGGAGGAIVFDTSMLTIAGSAFANGGGGGGAAISANGAAGTDGTDPTSYVVAASGGDLGGGDGAIDVTDGSPGQTPMVPAGGGGGGGGTGYIVQFSSSSTSGTTNTSPPILTK